MPLVHGSRRRWVMSRSSVVPVRALPIQGLRVDQGMGRFPTGRRPGPSQALTSGPVSNREHDRPGGPSGRRRRSAFPVPRRAQGPRPLAGHLKAVLDPRGSGTPSFKLCFGSSEPFVGVCNPYTSSAAARRRPPRSTGVAVAVAIGRLVAGLLQMAALVGRSRCPGNAATSSDAAGVERDLELEELSARDVGVVESTSGGSETIAAWCCPRRTWVCRPW
jgi:hypothetical protein